MDVWLVGAGGMAQDYAKALKALDVETTVIGRGDESARKFSEVTKLPVVTGGLDGYLNECSSVPDAAIICVNVELLAPTCSQLLKRGVKRILVEKPAALYRSELMDLLALVHGSEAEVYVAYNRRFYAATMHAQRMIREDGGLTSCQFDFTEWGHVVEGLTKGPGVKQRWFLGNSTHVVDLAFYLAGKPAKLSCYTSGSLPWHDSASVFTGAGVTDKGVLFSYHANWGAPGRWSVEFHSKSYKYIFRPMESLQVVRKGSVAIEPVEIDSCWDTVFKPGLFEQLRCFLGQSSGGLCSLTEQLDIWDCYIKMANYSTA